MKSRIKNKIQISEFSKNVITLIAGVSVAQLIPIIITPLLTQFFSPEQFGTYGLYVSIYTILGIISCGKYDIAIMLPKKKIDSINIVAICFTIASIFSLLTLLILFLIKDLLFDLTRSELFKTYYWIIPLSILLYAFNQTILVWYNRNKQYNYISENNLLKSSSNSLTTIILGFKNISTGLIIGNILSLLITSLFNFFDLIKSVDFSLINKKNMRSNFFTYIKFLKYSTTSNLFNSLTSLGMTPLIVLFFGVKTAGLYFLAEKLIAIPISLITSSIAQVYFQKATTLFNSNKKNLLDLTIKVQKQLFLILAPLLFLISIFGENLFYILGENWSSAGKMIKYFSIYILFKNIYSPISTLGDILGKQKLLLIFNISLFLFQISSFYLLNNYNEIYIPLLVSSFFGATHYVLLSLYMRKLIK